MSMTLPLHESTFASRTSSAVSASPVAPSPAVASASTPVAAPRFSLLGLILATSLVAVLCGAIFGMPFRPGSVVLLVVNLCFAPVALSGLIFGQGYLRAACLGLLLPGLLAWVLAISHFRAVATAVDLHRGPPPGYSPYAPYYPVGSAWANPNPIAAPPSYAPASSAPPSETPTSETPPTEPQAAESPPEEPRNPGFDSYGPPSTRFGSPPTPPQLLPPPPPAAMVPQTAMEYFDPDLYQLRVFLMWNAPLALLCVACAVGTKWFGDSQPAA